MGFLRGQKCLNSGETLRFPMVSPMDCYGLNMISPMIAPTSLKASQEVYPFSKPRSGLSRWKNIQGIMTGQP